jgi:hypothetical protein
MEYADMTLFKYIEQNNTKLNHSQRIGIINQMYQGSVTTLKTPKILNYL